MANPTSKIDFSIPLATFLATAISDGFFSDILQQLKVDDPGEEADATDIDAAGGQLWSNIVDDFMLETYAPLQGAEDRTVNTVDATPDAFTVFTLAADADAVYIRIRVAARTAAVSEILEAEVAGTFYRTADGFVSVLNPISSQSDVGLAGATVVLAPSGNDVVVTLTGLGGTPIEWTEYILDVKPVIGP